LKSYTYTYDALDRLASATDNTGNYNVSNITYDKMGNIETLTRQGAVVSQPVLGTPGHFGVMDDLIYSYHGNQLYRVVDNGSDNYGFKDVLVFGGDYTYDGNGNMTRDANKGITSIEYNHLNLPVQINFANGNIQYIYDASGVKLKKTVTEGSSVTITDYAGNYIYENRNLQFFSHSEGYIELDAQGAFNYVYQYIDHLGNIRLSYSDLDSNGIIDTSSEILQERNYYPFGLQHKGYNNNINGPENNYFTYQGVEFRESLGYNLLEFELRHYDPALGRFIATDPYEQFHSPYVAMGNNPVVSFDPTGGKCVDVNGKEVACPGDEMYDEYRDSSENHITLLDEVEVVSPVSYDSEVEIVQAAPDKFPSIYELRGFERMVATLQLNIGGQRKVHTEFGMYLVDEEGNITIGPIQGGVGAVGLLGGPSAAKGGSNVVYHSVKKGVTQYVGITNNLARRSAEHLAKKGINIQPLMKGLSRADARAVEQALIEIHGLGKNGGTLLNKINSISSKNPVYGQQLQRGYDLLKSIGY